MATTTMERMHLSAPAATRGNSLSAHATIVAGMLATRINDACKLLFDHMRAKRDIRRLQQLDDRMLRDIGLTRSEIASAVYGQARGERRCHAHR